ncbi:MAG TPA: hypothetical protein VEY33_12760 [Gemmatimonadota bacterium]|nr:hypothetical protein [Gemmatimonadota bacterium]
MGLEVVLKSGVEYEIVAFLCELWLRDIQGNVLFEGELDSYGSDDVLRFTAPADGTHFLGVDCVPGELLAGSVYRVGSKSQTDSSFTSDLGAYPADMIVGLLNSGGTIGIGVNLELGVEYMIVGVCDQDCGDLDLSLSDLDDNVLFTDELDDAAPVLQFTSTASGLHNLWITMYACSGEPCSFAYNVYRR